MPRRRRRGRSRSRGRTRRVASCASPGSPTAPGTGRTSCPPTTGWSSCATTTSLRPAPVGPWSCAATASGPFQDRDADQPTPPLEVRWQPDRSDGSTATGDAVHLELDRDRLPLAASVGATRLAVAATAVVPDPRRVVLALVGGP